MSHERILVEGPRRSLVTLALASVALLFAELLVVRWTGAALPRLAFFKNLVLIGAFLGGGIGIAAGPRRPRLAQLAIPALLPFVLGVPFAERWEWLKNVRFGGTGEHVWDIREASRLSDSAAFLGFMVVVFALALVLFVALGALVGRELARHPPLAGYGANLVGSLIGVLGFAAACAFGLSPTRWFALLALPLGFALASGVRGALLALMIALAGLVPDRLAPEAFWSPYSRISVTGGNVRGSLAAYQVDVNHAYFMTMLPLGSISPEETVRYGFEPARRHYDLPYRLARPERVLVLGAGGGNDVAAALRAGAGAVDAVEIDPVIVRLGRKLHPDHPYSSPRVEVHVDDARSFLRRTDETWNLVVLGLLDSHTLLAGLPGIRLDNYVYTLECFENIRRRLAPNGILALSFAVPDGRDWIAAKLLAMVREAFPNDPVAVLDIGYDVSVVFLAGPGLAAPQAQAALAEMADRRVDPKTLEAWPIDVPTDDWPHLYLQKRSLPIGQALLIALLAGLALLVSRLATPAAGKPDAVFALLGCGFLLVETKGISDLGLLFGGTWWTVTAVIAAVLAMAILSTAVVARRAPTRLGPWLVGLLASIALGWWLRPIDLLALPLPAAQALGSVLVALPVFFSGIVFATLLQNSADPARALGSNLLGSVLGGFLEYASLVFGVRALSLVAMLIYGLAATAIVRKARGT